MYLVFVTLLSGDTRTFCYSTREKAERRAARQTAILPDVVSVAVYSAD